MEYKDLLDMTFAKNMEERLKIQKKYTFNDYTKMTYSQINHAKAWGFSRRTPNLNLSHYDGRLLPKSLRGVPLNEKPLRKTFTSQRIGDVKWLRTNIGISIQSSISSMLKSLLSEVAFIVSIISIIISSGFRSIERNYW